MTDLRDRGWNRDLHRCRFRCRFSGFFDADGDFDPDPDADPDGSSVLPFFSERLPGAHDLPMAYGKCKLCRNGRPPA